MESHITADFRKCFSGLSKEAQKDAIADYRLWKQDPYANSLHFKPIDDKKPIYSVRAGIHYRAIGVRKEDVMIWYWIGSHAQYDNLIKNVRKKNTDNL